MTDEKHRRLKKICRSLMEKLSAILYEHVNCIGHCVPKDEFDLEAARIIARLKEAHSADDLAQIMQEVFIEMFDAKMAGPVSRYQKAAEEFWAFCKDFKSWEPRL